MSVTAPQGFRAAGVTAGLKASGKPDLALVVNDGPVHAAAGVFTGNRVKAAPVRWCEQIFSGTGDFTAALAAVVLNSGGANACTGAAGYADTVATAEHLAAALQVGSTRIAVCSTGLIGERLPMDKIRAGSTAAVQALTEAGGPAAATAIMTTDTVPKQAVVVHPSGFTVGGMAKGAGMLAPSLATMLVVITTDADVDAAACDAALRAATALTFDRVDSDGCQSTNDTVLLMASGASGVVPDPGAFEEAVRRACSDLAMQLVRDAEGADHDVAITVAGAASTADALEVARSIARNNLFKAAIFGRDPNWGRVMAAVGTTAAAFDPADLDVSLNGVPVCRSGQAHADPALVDLAPREVAVEVDLHAGERSATVWTNDLTHAYVHENSAYST